MAGREHGPAGCNRLPVRGEDFALPGGNGSRRGTAAMLVPGVGARGRTVHERRDRGRDHLRLRNRLGARQHHATVRVQVATDAAFQHVVRSRTAQATDATDNTVQTIFGALRPNTTYHYHFCFSDGSPCSAKGRFLTAPSPVDAQDDPIRLLRRRDRASPRRVRPNPFWGNFKAFQSMVAEQNDFNIDFGDTIYSDPEVPGATDRHHGAAEVEDVPKKLAIPNMQSIRSDDRALQPLGRPRVHQRLLHPRERARRSTTGA